MGLSFSQLSHHMLAPLPAVLVHFVSFALGICSTTNKKFVAHLCRFEVTILTIRHDTHFSTT